MPLEPDTPFPDPETDTSLHLRAAVGGSVESLGWLIDHLSPLLLVQAAWRLGPVLQPHYDAEDLVEDAWARMLPRLSQLPARDGRLTPVLMRFLATTIANRASNLVKKHIRNTRGAGATPPASAEPTDLSRLPGSVTGAFTACARQERTRTIRAALDELSPLDREIILLRAVEQRENAETAVALAISPDAASMRFSRALERLRRRLPADVFHELG